jgi:hypothetical protein
MSHDQIIREVAKLDDLSRELWDAWSSVREDLPAEKQNLVGKVVQQLDADIGCLLHDLQHPQ